MNKGILGLLVLGGIFAGFTIAPAAERTVVCEMVYHDDWATWIYASETLATIVVDNQLRTIGVENHIDTLDPYCTPEALIRWYYYPPPYYDTINHIWKYRHPWLYLDGDKHGGRDYVNWRSRITQRLDVPASVTIRISGAYDPLTRNGTARVVYRNDSTGTIHEARAIALITEDSIRYLAPSGDSMFNNVERDYVPDPYGQIISIPPGDSAVISQYFTADTSWNVSRLTIATWLQNDIMTADSVMPVYQGAKKKISELEQYVWEESSEPKEPQAGAFPNPCRGFTRFAFADGAGGSYRINIYDIQGRKVREISGSSTASRNSAYWDCRDDMNRAVRPGVYFYRIVSDPVFSAQSGKVIVR